MEMQESIQIVQKLYDLTKSNEKIWARTNLISQFTVESGKGRINMIHNDPDEIHIGPTPPVFRLLILNCNNEILEFIDSDIAYQNDLYRLMEKLWAAIEDQYYKKSETINSIWEDLGLN